ncbi:hypothetical protein BHM03_00045741 [Ensete ventricosum]|nr:hypothetical protein BHM03_00045741 [Ensete ventricosum]
MAKLYDRRVRPWQIKGDDLVLWKAKVSDPTYARAKLALNWVGPYQVTGIIRDDTYQHATQEGKQLPMT